MSKFKNQCLHTECIGLASRTLEIYKKYKSAAVDNLEHDIVFVYNHEGQYFRVYDNIQDLLAFEIAKCIAGFDKEDELDLYLQGHTILSTDTSVLDHLASENSNVYVPPQPVSWKYESNQSKISIGRWNIPKYIGPMIRGAHCVIKMNDGGSVREAYISFCNSEEVIAGEVDKDSFGISDNDIYYFAVGGEAEIKNVLMVEGSADFIVLSYELAFTDDSVGNELNYEMEVTDQRASNGQLFVDIGVINGDVDDILAATFEINKLPGTEIETQTLHLHFDGDAVAVSIFKKGGSYIIRPEHNVTIHPIQLDTGALGYVLN